MGLDAKGDGISSSTAADDRAIVDACLAGDSTAFDVIVERHRRQVYQLCFRYVGNHEDASDLAQDAFVRAFKGLKGFKGQSSLSTWLYRIAVNVCLNRVALKTPRAEALDPAERIDTRAERPDVTLLRAERAGEVRAAIRDLPPKQRATLILRVYHELPHEEIAAILGSSVGAAKANFFHALANLKKLLR
ncbi:MAG TPA: sigma-70 family RNA polymerase sigma factor [Vicinamibacterales bacterium]|nr:sigma-70 family RNA polymerase sigma factor [Vicinamibacterales bacterium]